MSHSVFMAKSKKKGDRHKASHPVRVKLRLAQQLAVLAKKRSSSIPAEVNRAVLEALERAGLWPPADLNGESK